MIVYLPLVNLLALAAMYHDKRQARRGGWRVRERTLFLLALLGGGPGIWAGMYLFRHKTRHLSFVVGIPAILLAQAVGLCLLQWAA